MKHINEGIGILTQHNIPFVVESMEPGKDETIVRMPDKMIDNLRELGFRVGKEFLLGGQVVFYKGKLFGMTMG